MNKLVNLNTDLEQSMSNELVNEGNWDYGTAADFNTQLDYTNLDQMINSTEMSGGLGDSYMAPRDGGNNTSGIDAAINANDQREDPKWIPDDQAMSCAKCNKDFTVWLRRHHCRICFKVFCKNCSTSKVIKVAGDKKAKKNRACKSCIK